MCAVSMISEFYNDDNYRQRMTNPMPWPTTVPASLPWTHDSFKLLQELMEKMKQLHEKLGLPNCEDPKKAEWMKSIETRLSAMEKKSRKRVKASS